MKLVFSLVLHFLVCSHGSEVGVRSYKGYKVYSATVVKSNQYRMLRHIYDKIPQRGFDFWTEPVINGTTDVMVAPEHHSGFVELLQRNKIQYQIMIDDVQSLIDKEKTESEHARIRSSGSSKISWDYYASFSEIEAFVQSLPQQNSIAGVESIGKSFEGRDLYAVKISNSPSNRKAIFIDANMHAREWISSATATWILNEFVTNSSMYAASHLDDVDFIILPMVNPDGYEFSRTSERLWRKTRSVYPGSDCRGADPDRNFPFHFGEGASTNPCSEVYKGPSALSESETKAIVDYIKRLQNYGADLTAYISLHSYGQYWLLPWCYAAGTYPPDYNQQLSLGKEVVTAIQGVYGTRYITGSGADVLYSSGGRSDDYAKSVGIKYTVTAEMRDTGAYGFTLPPSQIVPNAKEIMAALEVVVSRVRSET